MITTHTHLINALIEKHNLRRYLEIGVQSPQQNFDKINAEYKLGIDPEIEYRVNERALSHTANGMTFTNVIVLDKLLKTTSDDYFKVLGSCINDKGNHFDLIFIDGLHTAEQVKRDFENSLRCLSDNGFIVIHDVLPENEAGTLVPRIQRQWWGDVYKWAMVLRNYSGIRFVTFNIDNGCMLVWKDNTAEPLANYVGPIDWETYKSIGSVLLNVTNEVVI